MYETFDYPCLKTSGGVKKVSSSAMRRSSPLIFVHPLPLWVSSETASPVLLQDIRVSLWFDEGMGCLWVIVMEDRESISDCLLPIARFATVSCRFWMGRRETGNSFAFDLTGELSGFWWRRRFGVHLGIQRGTRSVTWVRLWVCL